MSAHPSPFSSQTPITDARENAVLLYDSRRENESLFPAVNGKISRGRSAAWFSSSQTPAPIFALSCLSTAGVAASRLLLVTLSRNKPEGRATTKLASLFSLGVLPPFLLPASAHYSFMVLPSDWLAQALLRQSFHPWLYGWLAAVLWLPLLAARFRHKMAS